MKLRWNFSAFIYFFKRKYNLSNGKGISLLKEIFFFFLVEVMFIQYGKRKMTKSFERINPACLSPQGISLKFLPFLRFLCR